MKKIILIAIGGFFGAICRYAIKNLQISGTFPVTTIFINVIGSFILAFVITYSVNKKFDAAKLGITTGFCGAFTTFSTLCKESVLFIQNGNYSDAVTYLLFMVILGLFAAYCGVTLANLMNYHKNIDTEDLKFTEMTEDDVE